MWLKNNTVSNCPRIFGLQAEYKMLKLVFCSVTFVFVLRRGFCLYEDASPSTGRTLSETLKYKCLRAEYKVEAFCILPTNQLIRGQLVMYDPKD